MICVCVSAHTCRHMHMYVHVCMEAKVNLNVILQASPPLLSYDPGSLLGLKFTN